MAKKREERTRTSARPAGQAGRGCDLDGGYVSPVRSCKDLSLATVADTLKNSRYVQVLLTLTLIGILLRFSNLGFNSLWLDEASTYTFATLSIPGIWGATTGGEFNPPLFYWTEHVMLIFGNSEVVLRFIPALLGVLTIPLVYCIGREFCDRNVGIIAAAGIAFSPFLIFYSQEARAYSMMLFFIAAAMVFFLKALKSDDLKEWALFGILSALAFWSHFYAAVLIGALVLYALYERLPKIRADISSLRSMAAGIAVLAVLSLPLLMIILPLFARRTAGGPTFGYQGIMLIAETFRQVLTSPLSLPGSDLIFLVLLVLFVVGVIQAFLIDRNKGVFLVSLTVLTFVISFILSYRIPMMPRYLIFLSIILWIGVALAYKPVFSLIANPGVVYGFILLLFVMSIPFLAVNYTTYTKEDWRGVSGDIVKWTNDGDYVAVLPGYILQPLNYYYSNTTDRTILVGLSTAEELDDLSLQKGNATAYYIVTGDIMSADPSGGSFEWLKSHTQPIAQSSNMVIFTSPGTA